MNRREFLKALTGAAAAVAVLPLVSSAGAVGQVTVTARRDGGIELNLVAQAPVSEGVQTRTWTDYVGARKARRLGRPKYMTHTLEYPISRGGERILYGASVPGSLVEKWGGKERAFDRVIAHAMTRFPAGSSIDYTSVVVRELVV